MHRIRIRLLAWVYYHRGTMTFGQALSAMLPPQFRTRTVGELFGKPFIIPDGDILFFLLIKTQVVEANQYRIELIKDKVIDVGANLGIFSIFAAIKHPNATIYAFEPNPITFEALKENTKYYPNIKVFNYGIGEKNESSSIIPTHYGVESHIGEGGLPVEIRTLDSFGLTTDFIKIDTEGYEANVLKGAAETIKKYKPVISMAAYHKPDDKTELPLLVNSIAAYDCELRHDEEENLICKPLASVSS